MKKLHFCLDIIARIRYNGPKQWEITPKRENIMCRIRTFYECSDGTMGFAEMVLSYDEDIAAHIRHWSTGGRMVITEHIDLV